MRSFFNLTPNGRPAGLMRLVKRCVAGAALVLGAGLARADTDFVTVREKTVAEHYEAYGTVEPIAVLPVRAAEAGLVIGRGIVPGTAVQAGQALAMLGGPEVQTAVAQAEAAVRSARTDLAGAQKSLAIDRQQAGSHLATRQTVLEAETAAAQAQARFDSAEAQLNSLKALLTLSAPEAGTVLGVNAANGERVAAGETVFMLEPAGDLWLMASYYGSDAAAIRAGMAGHFAPEDGGSSIPVKVATVFGALGPDGGESVGLVSIGSGPGWRTGEYGTVTLGGKTRSLVAVPTRALILDQGKWWVLVRASNGPRQQAVVPGPVRGWETFIERGLEPGAQVIVANAYLEFHRGISQSYQPPD